MRHLREKINWRVEAPILHVVKMHCSYKSNCCRFVFCHSHMKVFISVLSIVCQMCWWGRLWLLCWRSSEWGGKPALQQPMPQETLGPGRCLRLCSGHSKSCIKAMGAHLLLFTLSKLVYMSTVFLFVFAVFFHHDDLNNSRWRFRYMWYRLFFLYHGQWWNERLLSIDDFEWFFSCFYLRV